jgi:thymidylate synthase (FAD)
MSARYTQMPDIHYLPESSRVKAQSKSNKQGTSEQELPPEIIEEFLRRTKEDQDRIYANYQWALDNGIAREIARINTPVSRYSKMVASANLLNWLKFLKLRMPMAAQWEIRQYANAVAQIVAEKFPRTWDLFIKE